MGDKIQPITWAESQDSSQAVRTAALKESESDSNPSQESITPNPNVAFCPNIKAQSAKLNEGRREERRGISVGEGKG